MINSVYYSSGLNNTGRASLYYVYKKLKNEFKIEKVISGIAMSDLLRGHGLPPSMFSHFFASLFKNNIVFPKTKIFKNFKSREFLNEKIIFLENKFGKLSENQTYFNCHLYVSGPNLFAGEIKLARNFFNINVPIGTID